MYTAWGHGESLATGPAVQPAIYSRPNVDVNLTTVYPTTYVAEYSYLPYSPYFFAVTRSALDTFLWRRLL